MTLNQPGGELIDAAPPVWCARVVMSIRGSRGVTDEMRVERTLRNRRLDVRARRRRRAGFSLVELVIVIIIIGVIAAIALPRVASRRGAARDTVLSADLHTIQKAIERFAAEHEG